MNVTQYYRQAVQRQGYVADAAQLAVAAMLDELLAAVVAAPRKQPTWLARWFRSAGAGRGEPIKGLYIWGGVGRGKTFLMDAFFDVLPIADKQRLHFHRFMILAQQRLHKLKKGSSGLKKIGREYARRYRILCLDEMHIADEGDAAIMHGLLTTMLEAGLILVTTSNRAPAALSADPNIQNLFRGAVDILQRQLTVVNLDGGTDYRLRHIENAEVWHSPANQPAQAALRAAFHRCSAIEFAKPPRIEINQRNIAVVKWVDGVVWFDFAVICGPPRARADYIEIARMFHTVIIQNIPLLNDENNEHARRFNLLIDELYDHHVQLIASSSQTVADLYQGTRLGFEFQRTISRLLEMRSHEYLRREHRG